MVGVINNLSQYPGFRSPFDFLSLIRRNLVLRTGFVAFAPGLGPRGEVARGDVRVGLGHEVLQEVDVMQREERATELFAGVMEVTQVGARECRQV